jgi:ATP-dependent DNA helicase RecQ
MSSTPSANAMPVLSVESRAAALAILKQYWGYDGFLPLQEEAVAAILNRQDSLVILPTGSGKSLCYQLPALLMPGTAIVVSPLLSLMKDQVDTLNGMGIPAVMFHGGLDRDEREHLMMRLRDGEFRLLYIAPEGLANPAMLSWLKQCALSSIVIDEAHCISQWGHDFRSAYRELGHLRERFPNLAIHAFTATATPPVRDDIIRQLHLNDCAPIVGYFDRPNLLYRVIARDNPIRQICEVVKRYPDEGGIVYCISRKDVEDTATALKAKGYQALPYHAGLSAETRQRNQDAFMNERVNIVVATVAFGMGIDRSNIRYVIHTGMPKAIESYQQEAGRAGRDRQDAECVLLYSGSDVAKWRTIMGEPESEFDRLALRKLFEMSDYCQQSLCRHRFLVEYFGQAFQHEGGTCQRCDYCLGEHAALTDGPTVARKILSGVARVKERFGAAHVAAVLNGSNSEKIRQFGHDRLSTYGILQDFTIKDIQLWADQLVYQNFLERDPAYGTLRLTSEGVGLLRGESPALEKVRLSRAIKAVKKEDRPLKKHGPSPKRPNTTEEAELLEELRRLRRRLSLEKRVPAYIIFSDVTLQHLAQQKPRTLEAFRGIQGVGEVKLNTLGPEFIDVINEFMNERYPGTAIITSVSSPELTLEVVQESLPSAVPFQHPQSLVAIEDGVSRSKPNPAKEKAWARFTAGYSLEEVWQDSNRARDTVVRYLCDYIIEHGCTEPGNWIDPALFRRIETLVQEQKLTRLKPIYDALEGEVDYEPIKIGLYLIRNNPTV